MRWLIVRQRTDLKIRKTLLKGSFNAINYLIKLIFYLSSSLTWKRFTEHWWMGTIPESLAEPWSVMRLGSPGTGCVVRYQTAWSTSVAWTLLWSGSEEKMRSLRAKNIHQVALLSCIWSFSRIKASAFVACGMIKTGMCACFHLVAAFIPTAVNEKTLHW